MTDKPVDDTKFDIRRTTAKWRAVPVEPAERPVQADTEMYIEAFRELAKIFNIFGSGFGFVTSDITTKLAILEGHLKNRDKANGNTTLQKMMDYEKEQGILRKDPKNNGARNLLRLNRASEFIELLIKYITERKDVPMSTCTHEAYEKSLAQYHTWLIRKAVGVAVYAVPSRETLLKHLEITEAEALELLPQLVDAVEVVHTSLEQYYKQNGLDQLP